MQTMVMFEDRLAAGRRLAVEVAHLRGEHPVVLGLPRGGVPVAAEVAEALGAPLDVVVVRKLGLPHHPELAMGAIGEGGFALLDDRLIARHGVSREQVRAVVARESTELARRTATYRRGRPAVDLAGRVAIVVDDGVATGSTARVACAVVRRLGATRVVLATPVAPLDVIGSVLGADEVVCVATPEPFRAVGEHYRDFRPTTDAEVLNALDRAAHRPAHRPADEQDVTVSACGVALAGHLTIPAAARAVVVFAHGNGSSRHSRRNQAVASVLNDAGFATLLLDLLTTQEEAERSNVFDIELLAARLGAAVRWLRGTPAGDLPVGLFGASTGAGAALVAAADATLGISAVVSRGGRPDLAGEALGRVEAPTLLVVGGADPAVEQLNRAACARLRGPARLVIVPGATHLFEEPGALAEVADLARDWFAEHLGGAEAGRA